MCLLCLGILGWIFWKCSLNRCDNARLSGQPVTVEKLGNTIVSKAIIWLCDADADADANKHMARPKGAMIMERSIHGKKIPHIQRNTILDDNYNYFHSGIVQRIWCEINFSLDLRMATLAHELRANASARPPWICTTLTRPYLFILPVHSGVMQPVFRYIFLFVSMSTKFKLKATTGAQKREPSHHSHNWILVQFLSIPISIKCSEKWK